MPIVFRKNQHMNSKDVKNQHMNLNLSEKSW